MKKLYKNFNSNRMTVESMSVVGCTCGSCYGPDDAAFRQFAMNYSIMSGM